MSCSVMGRLLSLSVTAAAQFLPLALLRRCCCREAPYPRWCHQLLFSACSFPCAKRKLEVDGRQVGLALGPCLHHLNAESGSNDSHTGLKICMGQRLFAEGHLSVPRKQSSAHSWLSQPLQQLPKSQPAFSLCVPKRSAAWLRNGHCRLFAWHLNVEGPLATMQLLEITAPTLLASACPDPEHRAPTVSWLRRACWLHWAGKWRSEAVPACKDSGDQR